MSCYRPWPVTGHVCLRNLANSVATPVIVRYALDMNTPSTYTDPGFIVLYGNGSYRIHSANCPDVKRDLSKFAGREGITYPAGTTLLEIAKNELADFIDEDPEYYDDETVISVFEGDARILPCARIVD